MANNKQRKSSTFSIFSIFSTRKPRGRYDSYEDAGNASKIYPSDFDKSHGIVGDRKVDKRADDFLIRIHKSHIMASESKPVPENQPVTLYPAGTA
jgi:hypothetical protein